MNCPEVRAALSEFIYGGLAVEMNSEIQRHLAGCPDCRHEDAAFRRVRGLLTAAPDVRVDAAAVYRRAAELQARRLRRWRRVAVAACAAAVLLAALFGLSRLEIHVGASEMVVRWGAAPAAPVAPPAPPAPPPAADPPKEARPPAAVDDARIAAMEDRLHTLSELVQAGWPTTAATATQQRDQGNSPISANNAMRRSARGCSPSASAPCKRTSTPCISPISPKP